MIQKIKKKLSNLDNNPVSSFLLCVGGFIVGIGLYIYVFSVYGAIAAAIVMGLIFMVISFVIP